jgi:hypothetical protein
LNYAVRAQDIFDTMDREIEMFRRHLREMLALLEDPECNTESLRELKRYWLWHNDYDHEIHHRLNRIERHLEEIGTRRCALSEERGGSGIMKLITGMEDRLSEERRYLTSWLKGSAEMTIVDPYFFSFGGPNKVFRTLANYTNWLEAELIPNSVKKLTIYHLPGPNGKIVSSFKEFCKRKNIQLANYPTNEIHDRVIIKNGNSGRALGTSFGGFGNKIAFMLDLPEEDLHDFKKELHRISMS